MERLKGVPGHDERASHSPRSGSVGIGSIGVNQHLLIVLPTGVTARKEAGDFGPLWSRQSLGKRLAT